MATRARVRPCLFGVFFLYLFLCGACFVLYGHCDDSKAGQPTHVAPFDGFAMHAPCSTQLTHTQHTNASLFQKQSSI
jgi:hypothetical protein